MKPANFFTYDNLKRFLIHMKKVSRVTSFAKWRGERAILLRHDVDLDLSLAGRMAGMELECGIVATYFVMTTSPTYNPLSLESREILSMLCAKGFEVGLHFDPAAYPGVPLHGWAEKAEEEIRVLESIIGRRIRSISLHNPCLHGTQHTFEGYIDAYDASTFNDDSYLSDSCMSFKDKDPYTFVENSRERPIQVLLHPFHYSEKGDDYISCFREYLRAAANRLDHTFRANPTFHSLIPNRELSDVLFPVSNHTALEDYS